MPPNGNRRYWPTRWQIPLGPPGGENKDFRGFSRSFPTARETPENRRMTVMSPPNGNEMEIRRWLIVDDCRGNLGEVQLTVKTCNPRPGDTQMWIFTKPIQQLQARDLEQLIAGRVRENISLEFKREMYGGKDADIREMLRDVSSLGNAEGGALIIGMEEDREGLATKL